MTQHVKLLHFGAFVGANAGNLLLLLVDSVQEVRFVFFECKILHFFVLGKSCPCGFPCGVAVWGRAVVLLPFGAPYDHVSLHICDWDLAVLAEHGVIFLLVGDGGRRLPSRELLHVDQTVFGPLVLSQIHAMHLVIEGFLGVVRIRRHLLLFLHRYHVNVGLALVLANYLPYHLRHHVLCAVRRVRSWRRHGALRLLSIREDLVNVGIPEF